MALKIVLIEDKDGARLKAAIQNLGEEEFEVSFFPPPPNLDLAPAFEIDADLYLVDYELDQVQPDESIANYRGATLATHLRERKPDSPIVLLTSMNLPAWTMDQRVVEASNIFDDVVYKDRELRDDLAGVKAKLRSIGFGYRDLRQCGDRSVSALLGLLKTDDEGREQALLANPPPGEWTAVEAAKWIRSILLRYPGVLYDCIHSAVALGISQESFNSLEIREIFEPAKYHGLFNGTQERWWKHSLLEIASSWSAVEGRELGLREAFRLAIERELDREIEPALDALTSAGLADTVCYFEGIPIRIENSLPYRPDNRPQVMDEPRVSFKAIQERNDVDENHLDLRHREMMIKIREEGNAT